MNQVLLAIGEGQVSRFEPGHVPHQLRHAPHHLFQMRSSHSRSFWKRLEDSRSFLLLGVRVTQMTETGWNVSISKLLEASGSVSKILESVSKILEASRSISIQRKRQGCPLGTPRNRIRAIGPISRRERNTDDGNMLEAGHAPHQLRHAPHHLRYSSQFENNCFTEMSAVPRRARI